jgi:alkyldihydroxyacetonephosphate synthase
VFVQPLIRLPAGELFGKIYGSIKKNRIIRIKKGLCIKGPFFYGLNQHWQELKMNEIEKGINMRWNGWGYENVYIDIPCKAKELLSDMIGPGRPQKDYSLSEYLKNIPPSRLSAHPLISTSKQERLFHAHGQSIPDWIALRGGTLDHFPDGVAFPENIEQIQKLIHYANHKGVIIIPYGGGTSVVGHLTVPDDKRPVLSISLKRFNRMSAFDPHTRLATFEAGIKGPEIERHLNSKGFTLGHFPQSFEFSTLGGWTVTRSSGQQSLKYGSIDGLFAGGQMLTPMGKINIFPFPSSAAGPDIKHLIMGSEGRMGILTHVTVKVSPIPERDDVYGIFFPSWKNAVEAVRVIMGKGIPISMLRLSNPRETETNLALAGHKRLIWILKQYLKIRRFPDSGICMALIGFAGSSRMVSAAFKETSSHFRKFKGVWVGKSLGKAWQKNRFRAPYFRNTLWDLGYVADTLETAVNWDKITQTMEHIEKVLKQGLILSGEKVHAFSHLSHVYPTGSNIYTTFLFRLADTPEKTLIRWKYLKKAASRVIINACGTISHQHGIGIDHLPYLPAEKGNLGMELIQTICSHVDPDKQMNPGKLVG